MRRLPPPGLRVMLPVLGLLGSCDGGPAPVAAGTDATPPDAAEACADPSTWYPDADGDGYGDMYAPTEACERPAGSIEVGGDCDDARAEVRPGATEVCNDGLDNNCDGSAPGCAPAATYDLAAAAISIAGLAAYDRLGTAVTAADLHGYGRAEIVVAAPAAPAGTLRHAGSTWSVSAGARGAVVLATTATWAGAEVGEQRGDALAVLDDLDGDGARDLLLGAPSRDGAGGREVGGAYAVSLAAGEPASVLATIAGTAPGERAGFAVAAADLDGDGAREAVVGAYGRAGDASGAGWVGAISLAAGTAMDLDTDAGASLSGAAAGDRLGYALATGDVDGDGVDDLLVGAPGVDPGGAAYLVLGPWSGDRGVADADGSVASDGASDALGNAVAIVGDIDGDGAPEWAVGAHYADGVGAGAGAVHVYSGTVLRSVIAGAAAGDRLGRSVAGGDVDGDGRAEVVVGAPGVDGEAGTDAGAVYVFGGDLAAAGTPADARMVIGGGTAYDGVGNTVVVTEVDGVLGADLLLGVPSRDAAGIDSGAVYVFLGGGV